MARSKMNVLELDKANFGNEPPPVKTGALRHSRVRTVPKP